MSELSRSATVQPDDASHSLRHDPALDGLRALAVLAVIAYHSEFEGTPAGFLGVDLFFVLSGYLITTLLIIEHNATGRVGLANFWIRRARRLLPALILLVATLVAVSAIAHNLFALDSLRADTVSSLLYVQNWNSLLSGDSYFAMFAEPSPLIHAWSLAIEEQWYVVWPILFLVINRVVAKRFRLAMIGGLAACSALAMAVTANSSDLSRAYFGTDTRAQALLIGAGTAFVLSAPRSHLSALRERWISFSAIGGLLGWALLVVFATDNDLWMYRGGFTFAALCVAIGIWGIRMVPHSLLANILGCKVLASIGKVSYGLYLWHWPVFLVLTADRLRIAEPWLSGVRYLATGMISYISYVALERPVKQLRIRRDRQAVVLGGLTAGLAIVAFTLVPPGPERATTARIAASEELSSPVTATLPTLTETSPSTRVPQESATDDLPTSTTTTTTTTTAPTRPLRVLLVGDSVWLEAATWFSEYGPQGEKILLSADTRVGCGTLSDQSREWCEGRLESWRQSVIADKPDIVVVPVSHWDAYDVTVNNIDVQYGTAAYDTMLFDSWNENLKVLQSTGATVAMMTTPCFRYEGEVNGFDLHTRVSDERTATLNDSARSFATNASHSVPVIDIRVLTCPNGTYEYVLDDVQLHRDGIHFTQGALPIVWKWLVDELLLIGDTSRDTAN
jgi:peptidoglycan/LPS O-acetylase OafA/YrhL